MAKDLGSKSAQMRERIAQLAARLMAEDGIQDYAHAKRKAARQMGAPDTQSLPSNGEVEQALRAYQDLYQKDEHDACLARLRQEALDVMKTLERFNPHLTGSVLTGTAGRHSDINLQLFADSAKEVELFLLTGRVPYETGSRRLRVGDVIREVPVFTVFGEQAKIDIAVLAPEDLRLGSRNTADGRTPERAKIKQVAALVEKP